MNKNYAEKLSSLTVFRGLLSDPVIAKLKALLDCGGETEEFINCYSDFAGELFKMTDNLSDYVLNITLENENPYMLKRAEEGTASAVLERAVDEELTILQEVSQLSSFEVCFNLGYTGYLAQWDTTEYDFHKIYAERIDNVKTKGYGIYAKYHTFMFRDDKIVPVRNPDTQKLSQLRGYSDERKKVIDNTIALLDGKPAANVLLYGDAGTGKSSTVKAIVNEFKDRGLRLIEIKKSQLHSLPLILDSISKNPLKFILFIDDLSFAADDDDFGALKAILEGSVSHKTPNLVIYATSNRRHLVKEKFSDREGDDIHKNDSMAELISLSDRFGLKVTFLKPDKKLYLDIVNHLAEEYEVGIAQEELERQAEEFALRRSGRSARAAKQFVESLKAQQ